MVETLNTFEAKDSTPEGHNEEMLARAAELENPTQVNELEAANRPEWLPEKFKSPEDMAKAYAELEKKQSSPKDEAKEEGTPEDTPDPEEASASEVAEVLDKAGVDFNSLQDEYNANGGLTQEGYEKLEKAGFPKSLVDSWIQGQEAMAQTITASVYETVGGEQQYQEMLSWAGDTLTDSEINAFNRQVDSGDPDLVRFAVQGLNARYRSEAGNTPKLVKGEAAAATSGAFQSVAELTAAMRDPRYDNDPAYRKNVADRLARSNVF